MSTTLHHTHEVEEVLQPLLHAGERLGVSSDVVRAAFPITSPEYESAILEIDGIEYPSWRVEVGRFAPTDIDRGGIELGPQASRNKTAEKAIIMYLKHLLFGTNNIGGKGGINAPLDLDRVVRIELFKQHALKHGYHPFRRVGAQDLHTDSEDMDAATDALYPYYGKAAELCFSGTSISRGGLPEHHNPRTGRGAGRVLLQWYLEAAEFDPTIKHVLESGGQFSVNVQGLGKAGKGFLDYLPKQFGLKTVLEMRGGLRAKNGFLDPKEVMELRQHSLLGPDTPIPEDSNAEWISEKEFWETPANVLAPAFDKDQVTSEIIKNGRYDVILCIANKTMQKEAIPLADEQGIEIVPDYINNSGATVSSKRMYLRNLELQLCETTHKTPLWTPEADDKEWLQIMEATPRRIFRKVHQQRQLGKVATISDVSNEVVVERAVQRAQQYGFAT